MAAPNPIPFDDLAEKYAHWKEKLRRSNKGFLGDEYNVIQALRTAPELRGLVRHNEFTLAVELAKAPPWRHCPAGTHWGETDDTALQVWLQGEDINVRGRATVADSVALVATDARYHPVRDYLDGLQWDGEQRLATWLQEYLNAEGSDQYLAAIGAAFLRSAVARIQQPGCQVDHVLVLEASQGSGKTSAVRALAVRPDWYAGSLPEVHSKDAALQLVARWVVEVAELKAIRNSQVEAVKAFITETADTFRPPYGRRTVQFPRQCVFIATTNEAEYLRDRTGNRRYWPVKCGRVRVDALVRDRDQLWAEAVHTYRAGEIWHLTAEQAGWAADEQRARVYVSELESEVAEYLIHLERTGKQQVSVREVLECALHLDPEASSYADQARKLGSAVAEALTHCGWEKEGRARGEGTRRTMYRLPLAKVDKVNE